MKSRKQILYLEYFLGLPCTNIKQTDLIKLNGDPGIIAMLSAKI